MLLSRAHTTKSNVGSQEEHALHVLRIRHVRLDLWTHVPPCPVLYAFRYFNNQHFVAESAGVSSLCYSV